jgi:hypothetical protein
MNQRIQEMTIAPTAILCPDSDDSWGRLVLLLSFLRLQFPSEGLMCDILLQPPMIPETAFREAPLSVMPHWLPSSAEVIHRKFCFPIVSH